MVLERKQKGNRKEIERKEKKQERKNKENGKSKANLSQVANRSSDIVIVVINKSEASQKPTRSKVK